MEAIRCRCSADKTFVHRIKSVSVFCLSGVAWEKKKKTPFQFCQSGACLSYYKVLWKCKEFSSYQSFGVDPLLRACWQPRLVDALSVSNAISWFLHSPFQEPHRTLWWLDHCSAWGLRARCPSFVTGVSVCASPQKDNLYKRTLNMIWICVGSC